MINWMVENVQCSQCALSYESHIDNYQLSLRKIKIINYHQRHKIRGLAAVGIPSFSPLHGQSLR